MSSPLEKSIQLYSQTLGNQNAIKYVEEPLHEQCQQRRGNSSLQNRYVIIQIEAAQNGFAQASSADQCGQRCGADVDYRAGLNSRENRARCHRQIDLPESSERTKPQSHSRFT